MKAIDHVQASNETLPQRSRRTVLDLLKAFLLCGADIDQILDGPLQKPLGVGAEVAFGKEIVPSWEQLLVNDGSCTAKDVMT